MIALLFSLLTLNVDAATIISPSAELVTANGTVSATFEVQNAASAPLVIVTAQTSDYHCDASFDPKPIMQRGIGHISVICRYLEEGMFNKTVQIYLSDSNEPYQISVSGRSYVKEAKRVADCVRPYSQRPSSTWLEDEASLISEGLSGYENYLRFSKAWPEEARAKYQKIADGIGSCDALIRKLPKFVWIGDSLSKDFYVSSNLLGTLSRVRNNNQSDLFFDQANDDVTSFSELVSAQQPAYFVNLARPGASIARPLSFTDRKVIRKKNLRDQINNVLSMLDTPDYIGIWLGHNDLDWRADISPNQTFDEFKNATLDRVSKTLVADLKFLIGGLKGGLKKEDKKVAIMVYGIGNIEEYLLRARPVVDKLHAQNPKIYPNSQGPVYSQCPSLRPENRAKLIEMYRAMSQKLQSAVNDYIAKANIPSNIRVEYSGALDNLEYGNPENLNATDGWHLSTRGKNVGAQAIFNSSAAALDFLGL
ncbi:MAG: DUF1573 domain-containing protein [Bdellovibrionales bacterium]|nr:DUF1573 domain-containing protein [Bdellovibrionales bacterium]